MDTSMSTSTCLQVSVNMNLHVFQWQPFTFIRVQVTGKANDMQIT